MQINNKSSCDRTFLRPVLNTQECDDRVSDLLIYVVFQLFDDLPRTSTLIAGLSAYIKISNCVFVCVNSCQANPLDKLRAHLNSRHVFPLNR